MDKPYDVYRVPGRCKGVDSSALDTCYVALWGRCVHQVRNRKMNDCIHRLNPFLIFLVCPIHLLQSNTIYIEDWILDLYLNRIFQLRMSYRKCCQARKMKNTVFKCNKYWNYWNRFCKLWHPKQISMILQQSIADSSLMFNYAQQEIRHSIKN